MNDISRGCSEILGHLIPLSGIACALLLSVGCAAPDEAAAEDAYGVSEAVGPRGDVLYDMDSERLSAEAARGRIRSQYPWRLSEGLLNVNVFDSFDTANAKPAVPFIAGTGSPVAAGNSLSATGRPFETMAGWAGREIVFFLNTNQEGARQGAALTLPLNGLRSVNPTFWWALNRPCGTQCPVAFRGGGLLLTFELQLPHFNAHGSAAAYVNPYLLLNNGKTSLFVGGSVIDSRNAIIANRIDIDNVGEGGTGLIIANSSLRADGKYATLRRGSVREGVSRNTDSSAKMERYEMYIGPEHVRAAIADAARLCATASCRGFDANVDLAGYRIEAMTINAEVYDRDPLGWAQIGGSIRGISLKRVPGM